MPKIIQGLPSEFELSQIHQVVSMFKAEWPHGFEGDNSLRDWIHPECDSPYYLMLCEDCKVLAHTSVLSRNFSFESQDDICIQGLSGVITSDGLRGKGLGSQLVARASHHIFESKNLDLGMFNCDFKHIAFYEKLGWLELKDLRLEFGEFAPFEACDEATMYRVFSAQGQRFLDDCLKKGSLYFGNYLW
jgi:hypothetical protein